MSPRRAAAIALMLALLPRSADAGANASAHAFLSWSSEDAVGDMTPDATGRLMLYLHVVGARDVAGLRFETLWSADLRGGGRLVWPEPQAAEGPCGVTDGHPGRWGRVIFPSGPRGDFCVAMEMEIRPADAPVAGRFRPAYVRLVDSAGEIDEIAIETADIVLNGGGDAGGSFVAVAADRSAFAGGFPDTIRVSGYGFEAGMEASLRSDAAELPARVLERSWTSLALEVDPPFDASGIWRLHLQNATGLGYADSSLSVEVLAPVGPRVWQVPTDFAKVREALDAASPGDTVMVFPGTYENDHAWIVNKDGVALLGSGADRTVIRARNDAVLGIVGSQGVRVSGFLFEVDNAEAGYRVPVITSDASCAIEDNVFVLKDCRMCGLMIGPRELRFAGNTVVKLGEGTDLFVRVALDTAVARAALTVERNLSSGFNAALACESCSPPEGECNWDPGRLRVWLETISGEEPEFVDVDGRDFRLRSGSPGLPENNPCGVPIGALPGGGP